jgi:hypothetical protein
VAAWCAAHDKDQEQERGSGPEGQRVEELHAGMILAPRACPDVTVFGEVILPPEDCGAGEEEDEPNEAAATARWDMVVGHSGAPEAAGSAGLLLVDWSCGFRDATVSSHRVA